MVFLCRIIKLYLRTGVEDLGLVKNGHVATVISDSQILGMDVYFGRLALTDSFQPPYFSAEDSIQSESPNLLLC